MYICKYDIYYLEKKLKIIETRFLKQIGWGKNFQINYKNEEQIVDNNFT